MLKKWFKNYLGESHCKHKYIFIKMQDNENFKKGTLGVVYIYQCEKCGKEKLKCKNNNEINNEFLDI
ncbi:MULTISPECIES: hypothetical protein [Bacillus]|uniref:Zinc finger protein 100 n=3 Tax=Bacillus cereus TaxID=1396 RepID=A0A9W5VT83_BACCE|nr:MULTISPECIES: hypothetical protein [Bacillus]MCX2701968.1 hypothetical protein [Bacillus sp. AS_5]ACK61706.1 conserved hypothetical protein [Bacillus cereus B4264]AKE16683.1 hypothetical protein FORC5_2146 [Bacillus cereus]ASI72705.1 hypothetical protein BA203_11080 [Bacillus cereus]ASI83302.1 hypothetical protein FORC48_2211 [Bacillus cereus]